MHLYQAAIGLSDLYFPASMIQAVLTSTLPSGELWGILHCSSLHSLAFHLFLVHLLSDEGAQLAFTETEKKPGICSIEFITACNNLSCSAEREEFYICDGEEERMRILTARVRMLGCGLINR